MLSAISTGTNARKKGKKRLTPWALNPRLAGSRATLYHKIPYGYIDDTIFFIWSAQKGLVPVEKYLVRVSVNNRYLKVTFNTGL